MKVQINPANAVNKQVTFKTSDPTVATVSSDGTVA
ncbi:Ig-like domain-containing protein [Lacticaseibacillus rhamnosus]|nr:Ig-like domain-containing protein [Lacticaseibacillus rhamnosus]MDE3301609.1 Ig-like domain-containing protein [Lacticaseibacillus rhamnosus]